MALLVGAALALAGAEMQTVLENPLAEPFTLGVSSSAALGAAVAIVLGLTLPGLPRSGASRATPFSLRWGRWGCCNCWAGSGAEAPRC